MRHVAVYVRVSSKKQGRSGHGQEAQQSDVWNYASRYGGEVLAETTELGQQPRVRGVLDSTHRDEEPRLEKRVSKQVENASPYGQIGSES